MAPANAASVRSSHTNQTRSIDQIDRHSRTQRAAAGRLRLPKILYQARARIEQAVGKLKRFKRIALRCEKTAQNYASFVALALGFILIKSVHTT